MKGYQQFKEFTKDLTKEELRRQLYLAVNTPSKSEIPWKKYDPENPPKNFVTYLISNEVDTSKGYFIKFGNECNWYPDDCGSFDGDDVTYYASINLPGTTQ